MAEDWGGEDEGAYSIYFAGSTSPQVGRLVGCLGSFARPVARPGY